jgi:hypothetical protein
VESNHRRCGLLISCNYKGLNGDDAIDSSRLGMASIGSAPEATSPSDHRRYVITGLFAAGKAA